MTIDLGGVIAAAALFVGLIIWSGRQESSIKNAQEKIAENKQAADQEIRDLKVKYENLDNKIIDKLSLIEKHLANIEGRLSISFKNEM